MSTYTLLADVVFVRSVFSHMHANSCTTKTNEELRIWTKKSIYLNTSLKQGKY